jgi:rubrerythrin
MAGVLGNPRNGSQGDLRMRTLTDALTRRLGLALWEMGRAEAVALSVLTLIKADSALSAEERRFLVERMIPEERRHAATTRRWAARFAPPPRNPSDVFGAMVARDATGAAQMRGPARLTWIFATTHWAEKNTIRSYRVWIPIFRALSAEMAQDFETILAEERGHVAWGERVLRRLEREDLGMFRRIKVASQLVRRIYSTAVHQAHTELYHELEAAIQGGAHVQEA